MATLWWLLYSGKRWWCKILANLVIWSLFCQSFTPQIFTYTGERHEKRLLVTRVC